MKIAICTPCLSGEVNLAFSISLNATLARMQKTETAFFSVVGSSIIHLARCSLVAQAMEWGADKIVFIDDDISWRPQDFERLILAPEKLVCGAYQKKPFNVYATAEMAISALPGNLVPNDKGLCEIDGAATGFLRIDREVIEGMKPFVQKIHDDSMSAGQVAEFYEYFYCGKQIRDGRVYTHGEDFYFCAKAREAGFRTFVDPKIELGHHLRGFKFDAKLKTVDLL